MTQLDLARLGGLLAEASPLPWAYRPQEHDDWGTIRTTIKIDGWTRITAQARGGSQDDFPEHRRNSTDPFGPNAELIVAAVNALPALLARVRELEKGIEDIRQHTDPDDPDSYRCDDREGCLDTVQAIAAALTLNRSETDAG